MSFHCYIRRAAQHQRGGCVRFSSICPRATATHFMSGSPPAAESEGTPFPLAERRGGRRRFSRTNTSGRSSHVTEIMEKLRKKAVRDSTGLVFESLPMRLQLDILRRQYATERSKKLAKRTAHLPKFWSQTFQKKYFFREEDLVEESTKGRGPGGQATNRRMQTCILRHRPTGIVVRHSRWPSLWLNRRAARELLHLRIEERLVGAQSALGMQKSARERRERRRKKSIAKLLKAAEMNRQLTFRVQPFEAILRGKCPFPAALTAVIDKWCPTAAAAAGSGEGEEERRRRGGGVGGGRACEVTLMRLFNDKYGLWWPVLHALDRFGGLPCLLACIFPVVPVAVWFDRYGSGVQCSWDERLAFEQLARCRRDAECRKRVQCATVCVLEVFGITVRVDESADPRVVVEGGQPGSAHYEWFVSRWLKAPERSSLSATARTVLAQVYSCCLQLGLADEARALRRWIVKAVKREVRQSERLPERPATCWEQESRLLLLSCHSEVEPEELIPPEE